VLAPSTPSGSLRRAKAPPWHPNELACDTGRALWAASDRHSFQDQTIAAGGHFSVCIRPKISVWRREPISDIVTPGPQETAWKDSSMRSPTHRTGRRSLRAAMECAAPWRSGSDQRPSSRSVGANSNAMVTLHCSAGVQCSITPVSRSSHLKYILSRASLNLEQCLTTITLKMHACLKYQLRGPRSSPIGLPDQKLLRNGVRSMSVK
jgi:hypothetical protein